MSITLTIVTTANRTRRFTQSDPARIGEILDSLQRCSQLFSKRSLIVVADDSTEIFCPAAITRIEIETNIDLAPYLPPGKNTDIRTLDLGKTPPPIVLDNETISIPADFFFEGGDSLNTWLEGPRPADTMERTMRITRLFEQPIVFYQPITPGIGFMNPAVMTRCTLGAALTEAPTGAWHVKNA